MSDLIRIVDLQVSTHIGVSDEERSNAQRLLISLEMVTDSLPHAAGTDNLAFTINYANVAEHVKNLAARRVRKLIETLAEEMAFDLLKNFPIRKITLEIKKFILPDAKYVSVKIERVPTSS
jgi:7,8-dihydroneopterin aldolase/epimerase/oxygenase